jgi:hypothetical protein
MMRARKYKRLPRTEGDHHTRSRLRRPKLLWDSNVLVPRTPTALFRWFSLRHDTQMRRHTGSGFTMLKMQKMFSRHLCEVNSATDNKFHALRRRVRENQPRTPKTDTQSLTLQNTYFSRQLALFEVPQQLTLLLRSTKEWQLHCPGMRKEIVNPSWLNSLRSLIRRGIHFRAHWHNRFAPRSPPRLLQNRSDSARDRFTLLK